MSEIHEKPVALPVTLYGVCKAVKKNGAGAACMLKVCEKPVALPPTLYGVQKAIKKKRTSGCMPVKDLRKNRPPLSMS